jgi:L-fucose mutarotase
VERFDFYEAARHAYAVVLTGERRYYGNVLIRKGAIPPDA